MKYYYFIILFINSSIILGQPFYKYTFLQSDGAVPILNNSVNYHPLLLKVDDVIELPVSYDNTIFTVFCSTTNNEELIWQLKQEGQNLPFILTNRRIANLSKFKFLNYIQHISPNNIQLITIDIPNESLKRSKLWINKGIENYKAPIEFNRPSIPEIVISDKTSTIMEKQAIESYLAIKYGITLESDYINSAQEILWNKEVNQKYHSYIAGIGKDSFYNLNQKQGNSSLYKSDFKIEIGLDSIQKLNKNNQTNLKENEFVLWGETGDEKMFDLDERTNAEALLSDWKIISSYTLANKSFHFRVKSTNFDPSYKYSLAIDRSGSGHFLISEIEFYALNKIEDNVFEAYDVKVDPDRNGSDVFKIYRYKNLLVVTEIENANCHSSSLGNLIVKVVGPVDKYHYSIKNINNGEIEMFEGNNIVTRNLDPGTYELKVSNGNENIGLRELFISGGDDLKIDLETEYYLEDKVPLKISASNPKNGANYKWTGPDNWLSTGSNVTILKPGKYHLTIDDGTCFWKKQFVVREILNKNFTLINLYPNPSSGVFTVDVLQELPMKLDVEVFSENGVLLIRNSFIADKFHRLEGFLNNSGIYFLKIKNRFGYITKKLIIN